MSSSFHKFRPVRHAVLASIGACAAAGQADAAQTFFQPQVEARAETNSNLSLDPDGSPEGDTQGYIAVVQALIGIATPQSETSIRPKIRLQEYPDRDERNRTEGFLDLISRYQLERSRLGIVAGYSRQDSYNFDTRSGEFDPLDPSSGANQGSGRVQEDETRSEFEVRPDVAFDISERTTAAFDAQYRSVSYDVDSGVPSQIDYDYVAAGANVKWKLDERSTFALGAFANTFDPKSGPGESDGYGVGAGYEYRWSEAIGIEMTAFYETNDPKYDGPGMQADSSSGLGGAVAAFYEGEISEWRFSASHRFAPSANGRAQEMDQLRIQYDRRLSERLSVRGVARYESESAINDFVGSESVDTARADISLRWLFTPTWDMQGGYSYIGRDEEIDGDASNNRFFISIGYKALGRQQR
jgi:hypothetical protein